MTIRLRSWILIAAVFALATWMASCNMRPAYAQTPALDQQTTEQLEQRYEDLIRQISASYDPATVAELDRQAEAINKILTARNLAALHANTAQFEQVQLQIGQTVHEMNLWARRKWCHQTFWRLLRRYQEPAWCR